MRKLLFLIILCGFVSCSSIDKKDLVHRWERIGDSMIPCFLFFSDTSVTVAYDIVFDAEYKISGSNIVLSPTKVAERDKEDISTYEESYEISIINDTLHILNGKLKGDYVQIDI